MDVFLYRYRYFANWPLLILYYSPRVCSRLTGLERVLVCDTWPRPAGRSTDGGDAAACSPAPPLAR